MFHPCLFFSNVSGTNVKTFDVFTSTSSQKLDVESTISVGVIDNLLCLFCKKDETTHFLDVADLFSDDKRVHRESMERFDPEMHVETLSFLAPAYFLDTSGQGLLYEMSLSLPLLCQSVPPTACIVSFCFAVNLSCHNLSESDIHVILFIDSLHPSSQCSKKHYSDTNHGEILRINW